MMNRKLYLILCVLLALALFAGCTNGAPQAESTPVVQMIEPDSSAPELSPTQDAGLFTPTPAPQTQPPEPPGNKLGDVWIEQSYDLSNPAGKGYSTITARDAGGATVWSLDLEAEQTELETLQDWFYRDLNLYVIANNELICVNSQTGEEKFRTAGLGASCAYDFGEDGTLYISGFYGPLLQAIDASGQLKWKVDEIEDIYWPYHVQVDGDTILIKIDGFEGNGETNSGGLASFDLNGEYLGVEALQE